MSAFEFAKKKNDETTINERLVRAFYTRNWLYKVRRVGCKVLSQTTNYFQHQGLAEKGNMNEMLENDKKAGNWITVRPGKQNKLKL